MGARRTLQVGLIGHGFMGKAHSNAWRQAPRFFDLPADLRLRTICGRDARALKQSAAQFGWENGETDWRAVVRDRAIDIIDITTPNDSHCEIALAAAAAGKAILCEKPLANSGAEAKRMKDAGRKGRGGDMVFHNYRRAPPPALARPMIAPGGPGGRAFSFFAR